MSTIVRRLFGALSLGWISLVSCSSDLQEADIDCRAEQARVLIEANPGKVQSDGSVTVHGTVRFAPLYGLAGDGAAEGPPPFERSIRAVYVATIEAVPSSNEFNFRTWSAHIEGDRLQAQNDGTGKAKLPVDVYLHGGCVTQLPAEERPVVELRDDGEGGAAGAGGSGGSGGS